MGEVKYTEELDALFDNYLKTDPDIQRAMTEFVEQRKQDINEYYKRKGLPEPYLLEGEIMSWNVSGDVTKENAVEQIGNLEPSYEIGEGAKYQLVKARELAIEVIASGAVKGEQFGVNMGGHSKADAPDSALDSFNVSVYAKA